MMQLPHPILFLVSAPSGTGKTTLCSRLMALHPELRFSVSATTRAPREGEVDGREYHFLNEADFLQRVEADTFLEHARVHNHYYGTPLQPLLEQFQQGYSLLLDVDVQGGRLIREALLRVPGAEQLRAAYVDVFIRPPSLEVLRSRLLHRGKDSLEVIERRLRNAEEEMNAAGEYQYQILNDNLDQALIDLEAVYRAGGFRSLPSF